MTRGCHGASRPRAGSSYRVFVGIEKGKGEVKGVQIDDAGAVARPSVPSGIPTGP
jgi:hypothetical protein